MDQERLSNPSVIITTSRNPSHFLRRVCKILTFSIPRSERITRGSLNRNQLFNYCWNKNIPRILILHGPDENNSVLVKAYSIDNTVLFHEVSIRLNDFISIQKHNKSNRITISTIKLDFSEKIDFTVKKGIINFFNPIIQNNRDLRKKKILTLSFRQDTSQDITGYAYQLNDNSSILLYKITVSF
ncbi:MAG: hypothetical protein ACW97X_08050 [Candidatus Hodarchaeales archaeon]|jgi:rRNA maturation protein Rpf1